MVTKEKLELKEKVFFDSSKTTIKPESDSLLDEVAQVLKDHPEVKHVVIEGHTDSSGAAAFNTTLSKGRAEAVRAYLVGKGVARSRLEPAGFGFERPVASNASPSTMLKPVVSSTYGPADSARHCVAWK